MNRRRLSLVREDKMERRIKAVYFDLDGVLFDRDRAEENSLHFIKQTFWEKSEYDLIYAYWKDINRKLWKECSDGKLVADDVLVMRWSKMIEVIGMKKEIAPETLAKIYLDRYSDPVYRINLDCVLNMLKIKGYYMAVITNGVKEVQNLKIQRMNLNAYFDYIVTDQDSGFRKPDIRMFEYALSLHKVKKCEAIYVGDSYSDDVIPARTLGMTPILFNYGTEIDENKYAVYQAFDDKTLYKIISTLLR